jgi:Na+-driven multidrug efflux pump
MSSSLFQGTGKGVNALIATLLRTVLFTPPLAYLLAIHLELGLSGVWWGLVMANVCGAVISFTWVTIFIRRLVASKEPGTGPAVY